MLNINNVKKSFQTELGSIKRVFKGLELHVEKGDFISIIGSNGAGKSTLLITSSLFSFCYSCKPSS